MNLKPFFTFYGGKYRAAPRYPAPSRDLIIEPFAGSAGYSVRYHSKDVILIDKDPKIVATWEYLIQVSPAEIRSLPDLQIGETVDDLPSWVSAEARLVIGWWLNKGSAQPCRSLSSWAARVRAGEFKQSHPTHNHQFWGPLVRERLASQVTHIRHWDILLGDYSIIPPDLDATWFVDPPYEQAAGGHYKFSNRDIDYTQLAEWCLSLTGQVIVCENTGASWLPFEHHASIKGNESSRGGKVSHEAIFTFEV